MTQDSDSAKITQHYPVWTHIAQRAQTIACVGKFDPCANCPTFVRSPLSGIPPRLSKYLRFMCGHWFFYEWYVRIGLWCPVFSFRSFLEFSIRRRKKWNTNQSNVLNVFTHRYTIINRLLATTTISWIYRKWWISNFQKFFIVNNYLT